MRVYRAVCLGFLVALLPLAGCWTGSRADPARFTRAPDTIPPDAWPPRDIEPARKLMEATPDTVFPVRWRAGVDPQAQPPQARKNVESSEYAVTYKGLAPRGLLRIVERRRPPALAEFDLDDALRAMFTGFIPNAYFITSRTITGPDAKRRQERRRKELASTNEMLAKAGDPTEVTGDDDALMLTDGIGLRFPPVRVGTVRGLILHFHALMGNEYEPKVMAELERRGWAAVSIDTNASVRSPVSDEDRARIAELDAERARLWAQLTANGIANTKSPAFKRWSEQTAESSRLSAGAFQACAGGDLSVAADAITRAVDESIAGNAYAAQAALEYVLKNRPDLTSGPIVVVGFSAGALAAPTAAALLRDRVNAVVLIGGGADLFRISQESTLTNGGLVVRCGKDKPPRAVLDELDRLYLQRTRLDPYAVAGALRGIPVLQVHARWDTWVPAASGRLLYERLGRPDRMTIAGGHEMLFYFLPGHARAIADWLDRVVPAEQQR